MDGGSWADQWDTTADPYRLPSADDQKKKKKSGDDGSSAAAKYGKKVGEKTKAAASTGVKKVKQGTSVGFNWIKDKYQKTVQKH